MLTVQNGIIYVDNQPTTDPTLIGLAFMDDIENKTTDKAKIKKDLEDYFSSDGKRLTTERTLMIEMVLKLECFEPKDLVNMNYKSRLTQQVVPASIYNFLNSCVEAGILKASTKKYSFS